MNMKKTLAGVMAGAMAVSAMAATVSADQETIDLKFDLKRYEEVRNAGKVTIVEQYSPASQIAYFVKPGTDALVFGAKNTKMTDANGNVGLGAIKSAELSFSALAAGTQSSNSASADIKFTNDGEVAKKSADYVFDKSKFVNNTVKVPLNFDNTAKTNHINMSNFDAYKLGYEYVESGKEWFEVDDYNQYYGFSSITAKLTYEIPNQIVVNAIDSWEWKDMNSELANKIGISNTKKVAPGLDHLNDGLVTADSGISKLVAGDKHEEVTPGETKVEVKGVGIAKDDKGHYISAKESEALSAPIDSGIKNTMTTVELQKAVADLEKRAQAGEIVLSAYAEYKGSDFGETIPGGTGGTYAAVSAPSHYYEIKDGYMPVYVPTATTTSGATSLVTAFRANTGNVVTVDPAAMTVAWGATAPADGTYEYTATGWDLVGANAPDPTMTVTATGYIPAVGDQVTIDYTAPATTGGDRVFADPANYGITVEGKKYMVDQDKKIDETKIVGNAEYLVLNAILNVVEEDDIVDVTYGDVKYVATSPDKVFATGVTDGSVEEAVYPFKTTLNPDTAKKDNDVIAALTARKNGGNYYTKPLAVINDAIANHTNVTFTFTSFNGKVATTKSAIATQWVTPGRAYSYDVGYEWNHPTFEQHLYTNLNDSYSAGATDDYDRYGSYSSAWGYNLFTGAIVVNSGMTMQLSDTDKFNWGSNYLTFDWFSITDEGKVTDAKTFLRSMLLYTPVDWYWDSLQIVVSEADEDGVDFGEGLDGEGDLIGDEDDGTIVDDADETVAETTAETTTAAETTAAAITDGVGAAGNPNTGNAPVALAVIPVALAAAAVVAKKRS